MNNFEEKPKNKTTRALGPKWTISYLFSLDFGPEHTKAWELENVRACQEIIVFPN